tara:strand:- start:264 stop:590 length:327 start_codon:yes stop_codon:yes gene_type:complete
MTKLIAKEDHKFYFATMWLAIGLISSVDLYWAIKNQHLMLEMEENPIGQWLLSKDDGDVALFMGVKMAGTTLALGLLVFLYHYKRRLAWISVITVTILQFYLLYYLGY